MAITISANDANKDGKGINFAAYLANYNKTFTRAGYGGFNSSDPMAMSGTQYYSNDASKYGVVLTSGKTAWNYNMMTHKVTGSLNTVEFGSSIALDSKTNTFKMTSDVKITGLGVTDTTLGGQLLSDIMGGKSTVAGATAGLVKILNANSIVFNGSTGSDTFSGYAKDDTLSGGNGNDALYGNGGNDTLRGGNGNDVLYGDAGNDKLYGDAGNDKLYGGAGDDTLAGGDGKDTLNGGAGIDTLRGGNDDDFLFGYAGNDKLYGDAGNDRLEGGAGNDTLDGGLGNDILSGGVGADTFIIKSGQGSDRITDFEAGKAGLDVIQLNKAVLKNFADVLSHATETRAGDLVIKYGADTITLEGIAKADLHTSDFLFV
jgi:serralysin